MKHKREHENKQATAHDAKAPEAELEIKIETPEPELKEPSLEEQLAALQSEVKDWKDKYLRSMADFDNFRKRSHQEKSEWIKYASEKLALSVCEVLDNFERALMQIEEPAKNDGFLKGILLIEQQLRNVLAKEGIKKIEALGQEFDPAYHEALAHIPSDYEENLVAAIIQNGYTMNEKVIRPVRVAVSNGSKTEK